MDKQFCEVPMIHEEAVQNVTNTMPDLNHVVTIFKALADETRLKIAYALTIESSLCVCDVAAIIQSSNATASHHLRYLKQNGLAKSVRKGKLVFYSLQDEHVHQIIQLAYEHSKEEV
jgi:ArsR family transcriptional regulator, lead/cadmium/zinc/bismuth-responsive transcriptional repressor